MKTNHAVLLFIIIICLLTVTAYHVGYCQGYDKGKEDWFSIGEIAGRTNQIADQLRHNNWGSHDIDDITQICRNCTFRNYSQSNITYSTNLSSFMYSFNWSFKNEMPVEL